MRFINYFRKSVPVATPYPGNEDAQQRYYKKLRLQVLIAALLSHSLYYVCRTTLNVVKEPILDNGALNATQLGMIGSAMLFVYAVGKFVNGFLADYSNIKRFMAGRTDPFGGRQSHYRHCRISQWRWIHWECNLFPHIHHSMGYQRLGSIHGWPSGHRFPFTLVSAQHPRHLLRIFQCQSQPRRIFLVPVRRGNCRTMRLALGVRRFSSSRSHRNSHYHSLVARLP